MNEQNELLITHDWKTIFKSLGFVPSEFGGMKGRVEGIDISAIEDPLQGVCVAATHIGPRKASDFCNFISKECSLQMVGKLFVHIIEQVYPERRKKASEAPAAPEPQRKRPSKEEAFQRLPELLRDLFRIVDELEFVFERPFPPDGHMVGSIGEVIAAFIYDLELLPWGSESHDAKSKDGRNVQVKLTSGKRMVSVYGEPDHLIVLQLVWRTEVVEVYNGPAAIAWAIAGKPQKNGQRSISLQWLRGLQKSVPSESVLPQVRDLALLMK
ncbi:MAG: hypothetical protein ABSB35_28300 [Bryobacteraceae bacterium]|jgi:hypothetical protein